MESIMDDSFDNAMAGCCDSDLDYGATTTASRNRKVLLTQQSIPQVEVGGTARLVPKNGQRYVSNFDLGEESVLRELNDSMESFHLQPQEEEDLGPKIVCVRKGRRSMSYDIIFDTESLNSGGKISAGTEISIRIHSSKRSIGTVEKKGQIQGRNEPYNDGPKIDPGTSLDEQMAAADANMKQLESTVNTLQEKNKSLEDQVRMLNEQLGDAKKTIRLLEVEVVNLYCQ